MAFTHIRTKVHNAGASGGTSAAENFTGCDILIAFTTDYSSETPVTWSDSQANTWTGLTAYSPGNAQRVKFYYVLAPSVSATQTFTITNGGTSFSSAIILGFSGAKASAAFDGENGATNDGSASTIATGSVTPSEDNCLVIYGGSPYIADVSSVDVGTLAGNYAGSGGVSFGAGVGYQIQTTATARNPTFTFSASTARQAAAIAVFKAAAGGGGGSSLILPDNYHNGGMHLIGGGFRN